MLKRVVITGLGVINSIGRSLPEFWSEMLQRAATPTPLSMLVRKDQQDRVLYYRAVDCPDEGEGQPRAATLARYAAEMALADAGITATAGVRPERFGVCVGTGMGAYDVLESNHKANMAPTLAESFAFSRVGSMLATRFRAHGPNVTISTACSASGYGISLSQDAIRDGKADVMLTGGFDARVDLLAGCFHRLGALDSETCRPFDRNRKGTLFGEGATLLVVESAEHAAARGHDHSYGEILGVGWSCDGFHPTAPEPSGSMIERAMRLALQEAELEPSEIDCVLVHGTGTPLNDVAEGQAISRIFGQGLSNVAVTATKSKVGHLGGAAAALSCATAALMLEHGLIPPTANLVEIDEQCCVVPVSGAPARVPVRNVMINAYAFGGNNISLIVGKPR